MTRGLTSREDERAGLESIGGQLPFPVKGIDSDNDSVFINDTLTQYCAERDIGFTRSRPYRKNDRAWIEQKNGAVVRHFAGHDRHSGPVAGHTMAHLYGGDTVINVNADLHRLRHKRRPHRPHHNRQRHQHRHQHQRRHQRQRRPTPTPT